MPVDWLYCTRVSGYKFGSVTVITLKIQRINLWTQWERKEWDKLREEHGNILLYVK